VAGNLLARKRPRLIPVYDRLVRVVLERKDLDNWWRPLRTALAKKPGALANAAAELRDHAKLGEEISLLRILHACMWMRELGKPEPVPDAES